MLTLIKAITLFLGEQIESTRKSYQYVLNFLADYIGPSRPLDKVTPDQLIEFMQHTGNRPSVKSPATYNKYAKTIRTFFNWCVKAGLLAGSPAGGLRYRKEKASISRSKAMSDHQYEKLLDYAKWQPRYHALVLFLGDTGCRIGGAAYLQWKHVDLDNRTAFVTEKGKPARPVFFGEECALALRRWRSQCTFRDGDFVFSKHGKQLTNSSLGQFFSRLCRDSGVGAYGAHSLRHRKGHQFADNKVAPSIAAKALGHESVLTTLEYYYPDDLDRVQREIEKLAHKSARPTLVQRPKTGND